MSPKTSEKTIKRFGKAYKAITKVNKSWNDNTDTSTLPHYPVAPRLPYEVTFGGGGRVYMEVPKARRVPDHLRKYLIETPTNPTVKVVDAKALATKVIAERDKKKRKGKRKEYNDIYINKVLKQGHPDTSPDIKELTNQYIPGRPFKSILGGWTPEDKDIKPPQIEKKTQDMDEEFADIDDLLKD